MRSKQIILLIVIIVALAGAGTFAYLSFSGSTSTTPAEGETQTKGIILPHGNSLNFDKVNKFNETGRTFQYPAATPAETGLQLNEIISQ